MTPVPFTPDTTARLSDIHPSELAFIFGPRFRRWMVDLANAHGLDGDTDRLVLVALKALARSAGLDDNVMVCGDEFGHVLLNSSGEQADALRAWLGQLDTKLDLGRFEAVLVALDALAISIDFPFSQDYLSPPPLENESPEPAAAA